MRRHDDEFPLADGVQRIFRFDNGLSASVVRHGNSYGGKEGFWEAALIIFKSEDLHDFDFFAANEIGRSLGFKHGAPQGWLTEEEVDRLLDRIERSPWKRTAHRGSARLAGQRE